MNKQFFDIISEHNEYNIVGHMRPDGDCVGSQLAIYNILTKKNIKCHIIKNDDYGVILSPFFEKCDIILAEACNHKIPLICVDCSDFGRIGKELAGKYKTAYLNIDHHISNDNFARNNIVDASVASTTELIANLIIKENIDFDKFTAEMLYLGIMTDTGNFAYASTSINTIKIVELLMEKGISISEMYRKIYERDSIQKYQLLERFLHNMTLFADNLCCMSFVTEEDFKLTGTVPLDTEGFVNYTRKIDGVKIGAFLEFHKSYIKCSLRSASPDFRMDIFAKKFGGGGHPAAAGFSIEQKNKNFYSEFKLALTDHVTNFKHS